MKIIGNRGIQLLRGVSKLNRLILNTLTVRAARRPPLRRVTSLGHLILAVGLLDLVSSLRVIMGNLAIYRTSLKLVVHHLKIWWLLGDPA